MEAADWPAVRAIYLDGIATGNATFETEPPPWDRWDAGHLPGLPPDRLRHVRGDRFRRPQSCLRPQRSLRRRRRGERLRLRARPRHLGAGRALLRALIQASEDETASGPSKPAFSPKTTPAPPPPQKPAASRLVGTRERIGTLAGRWARRPRSWSAARVRKAKSSSQRSQSRKEALRRPLFSSLRFARTALRSLRETLLSWGREESLTETQKPSFSLRNSASLREPVPATY